MREVLLVRQARIAGVNVWIDKTRKYQESAGVNFFIHWLQPLADMFDRPVSAHHVGAHQAATGHKRAATNAHPHISRAW